MESIRSFCYIRGKSSLFVLANTLSIVPFILFLQLNTEHSFLSALPFVCFYTMRLFGIFFIKQSKYVVSSVTIEWLALVLGSVGMGMAMLGEVFFFFYVLASILIGLSASWLSAANLTINHYQPNKEVSMQYRFLIVSLLLILGSLSLASPWRLQVTFFMYLCLYLLAFSYLRVAMDSQLVLRTATREINTLISKKESRLFLGIWGLLFLLRVGRLVQSDQEIEWALVGFGLFFTLFLLQTSQRQATWKVAMPVNLICFMNGALGNYLILFGAIYSGQLFGQNHTAILLYLPYAIGMISALGSFSFVQKKLADWFLLAVLSLGVLGFCLLFFEEKGWLSFFILSYSHFLINPWLNRQYLATKTLHTEQQLFVKRMTQNKGAIIEQFLLMIGLLVASQQQGITLKQLFQATSQLSAVTSVLVNVRQVTSVMGTIIISSGILWLVVKRGGKNV